jgi:hypothetical protein
MDANWFGLTLNLTSTAANIAQFLVSRPTTPQDKKAYERAFRGAYWHIAQYRTAFEAIKYLLYTEGVEDRGLEVAEYMDALAIDDYHRLQRYSQDLRRHIERLTSERRIIEKHYSRGGSTPSASSMSGPWLDAYNKLMRIESQLRQLENDSRISLNHMNRLVKDVLKVQRAFGTALDNTFSIDHELAQKVSDIDRTFEEVVKASPEFNIDPEGDLGIERGLGMDL